MLRQTLLRALGPVTANALAVISFVIVVGTPWHWVGLAVVAVALTVNFVRHGTRGLGRFIVSHTVLAAGTLATYAASVPEIDWAFCLAATLTMGYISMENGLVKLVNPAFQVRHLRMRGRPHTRVLNRNTVYLADCGLILLPAAATILQWPSWVLLVSALAVGVLYGGLILEALYTRSYRNGGRGDLTRALDHFKPDFYLHWDSPPDSAYQVFMWLPYLKRLDRRFAVIVRDRRSFDVVADATSVPVVHCPTIAALDASMVPSLRAIFYVNNGMKNGQAVRFHELTHVQLLHGDSEKTASYNPVNAMFDELFVAGQAAIDRYARNGIHMPAEKFRIVGRPQVESVRVVATPISEIANKTVLYAPTWTGFFTDTNHCSLEIGEQIVRELFRRDVTVILRAHPMTAKNAQAAANLAELERVLAEDRAVSKRRHVWGAAAAAGQFADWANRADAMIADISSVISDYLYSEKPFAVTDMNDEGDELLGAAPIVKGTYVIKRDASNLAEVLDNLLVSDPLAAVRRAVKTYYLGDFPAEGYADVFVREANRVLDCPRRAATATTPAAAAISAMAEEAAAATEEAVNAADGDGLAVPVSPGPALVGYLDPTEDVSPHAPAG
ncbi:CDP-glycerol glycerophosphotransferase family protein [Luedemannella helvata]|uniref:CDP-glycerol glycerophosphotransferase family protein n=1 Tax=Luedemannella helvata TaxID=349315 RepID=A0ABN2KNV9_9ACTN